MILIIGGTRGTGARARAAKTGRRCSIGFNAMSWLWISLAFVAPLTTAFLFALPFWWKRNFTIANVVGSGVIFAP